MFGPLAVPPVPLDPPDPLDPPEPPEPPEPPDPLDPPDGDVGLDGEDGDDGDDGLPPEVFGLAGFSDGVWLGVLGDSLGDSPGSGSVGVSGSLGDDALVWPPPSSLTAAATTPPTKMSSTAAKSTPMNWRSGRAIGLVHHLAG
jgi:hypothetical protein